MHELPSIVAACFSLIYLKVHKSIGCGPVQSNGFGYEMAMFSNRTLMHQLMNDLFVLTNLAEDDLKFI